MQSNNVVVNAQVLVNAKSVADAERKVQDLRKEIEALVPATEKFNDKLKELSKAYDTLEGAAKSFRESTQKATGGIGGTADKAKGAAREAANEFEKASKSADRVSSSFERTGRSIFTVKDAIQTALRTVVSRFTNEAITSVQRLSRSFTGFFRDSVTAFAEFEKQIDRVGAITGATEKQIQQLSKQARELGASTSFSASEAAQAQQFLAQAGFSVDEIFSALPGTLELAAAGQLDLAKAADIASNVLSGLGLEVNEVGRVNDVLAKTASSSNTNVAQLGNAFKNAAPTVASAGESIEFASAAIGVLANAGIQGGKAGTDLRNIILSLQAPTGVAADTLKRLGIEVNDAQGNFVGLTNVLGQFEKVSATPQDLTQIFGKRGIGAFNILLKEGAQGLSEFTEELENSTGFAASVANKQLDNLAGDFTRVQSATEGLQIAIGELASGPLRSAVGGFANLIGALTNFISGAELTAEQTTAVKDTVKVLTQIAGVLAAAYLTLTARGKALVLSLKTTAAEFGTAQGAARQFGIGLRNLGRIASGIGFGLLIALVVELVSELGKLGSATEEAQRVQADYRKEVAKASVELGKERDALNELFKQLKETNDGSEERNKIIEQLNKVYGPYIQNLTDEEGKLKDLTTAQNIANTALVRAKRLRQAQQFAEQYQQRIAEINVELQALASQYGSTFNEIRKVADGNAAQDFFGFGQGIFDGSRTDLIALNRELDALNNQLGVVEGQQQVFGGFEQQFRAAADGVEDLGRRTQIFDDLQANLIKRFKAVADVNDDVVAARLLVENELSAAVEKSAKTQAEADAQAAAAASKNAADRIAARREEIATLNALDEERVRALELGIDKQSAQQQIATILEISRIQESIIRRTEQFERDLVSKTQQERVLAVKKASNDIIENKQKTAKRLAEIDTGVDAITIKGQIVFDATPGLEAVKSLIDAGDAGIQKLEGMEKALMKIDLGLREVFGDKAINKLIGEGGLVAVQNIVNGIGNAFDQLSSKIVGALEMREKAELQRIEQQRQEAQERVSIEQEAIAQIQQRQLTAIGAQRIALEREERQRKRVIEEEQKAIAKADAAQKAIEIKQAKREKALSIVEATINTAQAIVKAFSDLGPIGGAIATPIISGIGAAQIAAIQATPIPEGKLGAVLSDWHSQASKKYSRGGAISRRGGISRGPSHARGGIKLVDSQSGRISGEIEGNEVVLTSGVTRNPVLLRAASEINMRAGGVPLFNAGGIIPQSSGRAVNTAGVMESMSGDSILSVLNKINEGVRTRQTLSVEQYEEIKGEQDANDARVTVVR